LLYVGHSYPLYLFVILLHFSHDWSNWSSPSFSSTSTSQKLPGISFLLSDVSSFSTIKSHALNIALDWFLPYIYVHFASEKSLICH
jgi:hypothetical protein